MTRPGYYIMHDDMQMIRQLEMEKCFYDGQIPCRWGPDLGYGYGYPIFNFYPPLPYIIGQLTRFIGYSFVDTVKVNAILQFTLAAIGMYLLLKKIVNKNVGLIAAAFYTYAPYHFNNVYIRGAFNEAWASSFFPFILYFIIICIEKGSPKKVILLSFSIVGILLSHNPMAILFAPLAATWALFWLVKTKKYKSIFSLIAAAILSIGISAFFTLPVLFETKYVQIETMFNNYYSYVAHFTSLKQLFYSNFWGNGASFFGPKDGMSFQIGYFHWISSLVGLLVVVLLFIKTKKLETTQKLLILSVFLSFFALFMTHERSGFIWAKLALLQKVQFSWRWLNVATCFISISAALSIYELSKIKVLRYLPIFSVIFLILINKIYASPLQQGPLTDNEKFTGKAWSNQTTSGIYDYLPKTARIAPLGPAGNGIDEVIPNDAITTVNVKSGSDWNLISANLKKPAQLYLSRFDFPGTKVYVNTQLINHSYEPEFGRIKINLNSGQNLIYIKLENTPIRTIGNLVSVLSLFLIGLTLIWKTEKKKN